MGLVTGALPNGKYAGVALPMAVCLAMPGTDVNGPTALVMSAAKGQDAIKYTATHMNMKFRRSTENTQGTGQRAASCQDLF